MGILENAAEIDRLYIIHDEAEQIVFANEAAKRKNEEEAMRARQLEDSATEKIEMLFDGMACSIPSTVEEALGLAVLLRSQTDGSVFGPDHEEGRERVDRIMTIWWLAFVA